MFSGADAPWHWALIIILAIALFGYKKLPDAARAVGRSLRIFRAEMKGMSEDEAARASTPAEIVPPAQGGQSAQSAQQESAQQEPVPTPQAGASAEPGASPVAPSAGERDATAQRPADQGD